MTTSRYADDWVGIPYNYRLEINPKSEEAKKLPLGFREYMGLFNTERLIGHLSCDIAKHIIKEFGL